MVTTLQTCRNILVPVDFTPESAHAVREAIMLGRLLDTIVTVHHVIHDDGDHPGMYHKKNVGKKGIRHLKDAAAEMLEEFLWRHDLTRLAKEQGVVLVSSLSSGLPAPGIVEEAQTTDAGLILIATQEKKGLKGWLKGSVARDVMRRTPCPVLVLKGASA